MNPSVIVSEVSSFQMLKCMQEWYLGWENVSCSEKFSQFRSVLMREVPLYRLAVVVCQKPPLSLSNQGCVRATPAIGY